MNREEMLKRLKAGEDPLELSIQKWKDITNGKGVDNGGENCALCEKYGCLKGCPVYEKTGVIQCGKTPYIQYHITKVLRVYDELVRSYALEELEFLESLRKKEE